MDKLLKVIDDVEQMFQIKNFVDQVVDDYHRPHTLRYVKTIKWISDKLRDSDCMGLDVGYENPIAKYLRQEGHPKFGPMVVHLVTSEIRNRWGADSPVDFVMMNEVVEHIHDLPTEDYTDRAMWTGSGLNAALKNALEALRPGGKLFITTPNVLSVANLSNFIRGKHPMNYDKHVREYTQFDLLDAIENAGFQPKELIGMDVYNHKLQLSEWEMTLNTIRSASYLISDLLCVYATAPNKKN